MTTPGLFGPRTARLRKHPIPSRTAPHASHPSGHSIAGLLPALVLLEMVPEKRDAVLARAVDYAQNRVVCGLNYPSDLQASKLLAYSAYASINANPAYRSELAATAAELRAALHLPALAPRP